MVCESLAPCPAELHGSDAARYGLGLLYRRREECALIHACRRETCAIAGPWPERREAEQDAAWRLFAFIALAHAGPRGQA
jgi:hypothetical protein